MEKTMFRAETESGFASLKRPSLAAPAGQVERS